MRGLLLLATLGVAVAAFSASLTGAAASRVQGHAKVTPTINAPWAHEREDEEFDAPEPTAAALCRSSMFDPGNPYAATSNVDLINGDEVQPGGFSNLGCITAQNETTVAVNPTNPQNIVSAANDYRDLTGNGDYAAWAYYSMDGGATWTNVQVPGLTALTGGKGKFKKLNTMSDPALAFGPDGTLYFANIVYDDAFKSGVAVSVSKDGGATWGAPTMLVYNDSPAIFHDKEWVAAGPKGSVAVTWTRFKFDRHTGDYVESPIVMAASRDGGHSWSHRLIPVSGKARPYDQGSMPAFDSHGTLYVAYEGATPESGYSQDGTIVARSTDLGRHFKQTTVGRAYDDFDCYPTWDDSQTLTGEHFRLNSYPAISVDPTNGHVAVVWSDDAGAGSCGTGASEFTGTTDAHVKLVTSNNGKAYTAPAMIAGGDTVFPSVAAWNGKIAVSYYTRAYSPSTAQCTAVTGNDPGDSPVDGGAPVCLDYAARSSSDGFATERRLTTESSNPYIEFLDGLFIGDYSQIAIGSDGWAHPVWTDFRGNPNSGGTRANQDAYTQAFRP